MTGGFSRRTAGVTGAYGAWATVAALAMMWAAIACGVQPSAGGAQSSAPVLSAPKNLTIGIHTVISSYNVDSLPELCEFVQRELKPDSFITEIAEERVELDTA